MMCSAWLRTAKNNQTSRPGELVTISFNMLTIGVRPTPPASNTTGVERLTSR